jgi:2-polyprenyl-3-methyl-5-hydroxy-6-metoxy-1,4-benzoquinol methylase
VRVSDSLQRLRKEAQDEINSPVHSTLPSEGKDLGKKSQTLSRLLSENDEAFVRNAYRRILLREPDDAGFSENLSKLRIGRSTKLEILTSLLRSPEGDKYGIVVPGLRWRYWLLKLPLVGVWIRKIRLIIEQPRQGALETLFREHERSTDEISFRLCSSEKRIERLTANLQESNKLLESQCKQLVQQKDQLLGQDNQLVEQINKLDGQDKELGELRVLLAAQEKLSLAQKQRLSDQGKRLTEQKQGLALQEKRSDRADERSEKANNHSKESSASLQLEVERNFTAIEEMRSRQEKKYDELNDVICAATAPDCLPDEVYLAFENSFRGSREDVLKRLPVYLEYLPSSSKKPDILDLGCGRGEWLEFLVQQKYHPKGVDLNRTMVQVCEDRGLEVCHADGLSHLRSLGDKTMDVLTSFHLIEHLSLNVLLALFGEAFRVVREGGMIIFETPNPENLSVGSFTFHFDPTHRKPIPPALAIFYAENFGFRKATVLRHPPRQVVSAENVSPLEFDSQSNSFRLESNEQEQWPKGVPKDRKLNKKNITVIYRFFRSADPDPSGLDFWFNSGASTNDLVSAFTKGGNLLSGSDYALIAYKPKLSR